MRLSFVTKKLWKLMIYSLINKNQDFLNNKKLIIVSLTTLLTTSLIKLTQSPQQSYKQVIYFTEKK